MIKPIDNARTILDRLDSHAAAMPDGMAQTFLPDGWPANRYAIDQSTFGGLSRAVDVLASRLLGEGKEGARVVLLYPTGVHFVIAFLACLRNGQIAVPVSIPHKESHIDRLLEIIRDCEPKFILTTIDVAPVISMYSGKGPEVIATDIL